MFLPPLAALVVLAASAWDHTASDGTAAVVLSAMQPVHVVALSSAMPDRNQISVSKPVSCASVCCVRLCTWVAHVFVYSYDICQPKAHA